MVNIFAIIYISIHGFATFATIEWIFYLIVNGFEFSRSCSVVIISVYALVTRSGKMFWGWFLDVRRAGSIVLKMSSHFRN